MRVFGYLVAIGTVVFGCSGEDGDTFCRDGWYETLTKHQTLRLLDRGDDGHVIVGSQENQEVLQKAAQAFKEEMSGLRFVVCSDCWKVLKGDVFLFKKKPAEKCLLEEEGDGIDLLALDSPHLTHLESFMSTGQINKREPVKLFGPIQLGDLVDFINLHCGTYRLEDGSLNDNGVITTRIEQNIYKLDRDSSNCDRINASRLTPRMFFDEYVGRNKPVIIEGGTRAWLDKINELKWVDLESKYGNSKVHVKLVPKESHESYGHFECCENVNQWSASSGPDAPDYVLKKLAHKEKILVRPLQVTMSMKDFLRCLQTDEACQVGDQLYDTRHLSMYVEYLAISGNLTELSQLSKDSPPYDFLVDKLEVENIWISKGKTIGCLHFDPYENLLAQIVGNKTFTLLDPSHNSRLNEGHLREAMYTYEPSNGTLSRGLKMDSTSIVNSPLDEAFYGTGLDNPSLVDIPRINCTVHAGDFLYLPSFWWHHVVSEPGTQADDEHPLNLALNYWFSPLFTKEFPCQNCKLKLNPKYLDTLVDMST
mmetsp:Transcript_26049/g.56630  ORF Transcript_26049/g.56630 Transcript_26049/m.56630 type:complete len:536 (-) Transcript_26049:1237-2844(-)